MLVVEHLSASYENRAVLHDVCFRLERGQILALIGPNGAGKSTLLRVLSGVLPPSAGHVSLDGADLAHMKANERARRLAVVPQMRSLPPAFTAWEVVLLGRTPHLNWMGQTSARDEEAARRAMERTQTEHLANRRVGELSGGEQQALLLARALAQAAPLLLLDEPTTHLDLQHQLGLLKQVRGLVDSSAEPPDSAVVVLHDLNWAARVADQVALMVDGRLQALGAPKEVLTPERLSEAFQVPLQVVGQTDGGLPVILPRMD